MVSYPDPNPALWGREGVLLCRPAYRIKSRIPTLLVSDMVLWTFCLSLFMVIFVKDVHIYRVLHFWSPNIVTVRRIPS